MQKSKIKAITNLTNNLHDSVDGIYEELMDEENDKAITSIDALIAKLRHLKTNAVIKEN